jgi:hypothetical protein
MEWIISDLTDLMGAYWWLPVSTVIGTVAILSGLAAPIAQRLEEAHGTLVFRATYRSRSAGGVGNPSILSGPRPGHTAPTAVLSLCGPSRTSGRP